MALSGTAVPPWLQVTPQFFTSALESGARLGLAVSEAQQRAEEAALNRSSRERELQSSEQARAQAAAERRAEFQQEQDLAREKLGQTSAYESQREARLLQFDMAKEAMEKAKQEIASKRQDTTDELAKHRLNIQDKELDARLGLLDLQKAKLETPEEPTFTKDIYGEDRFKPIGKVSGPLSQMRQFMQEDQPAEAPPVAPPEPSLWQRAKSYLSAPSAAGTNPLFPPMSMVPGRETAPVAPAESGGVRVRRKSDGATFNYKGNPDDVPEDQFEVIQ